MPSARSEALSRDKTRGAPPPSRPPAIAANRMSAPDRIAPFALDQGTAPGTSLTEGSEQANEAPDGPGTSGPAQQGSVATSTNPVSRGGLELLRPPQMRNPTEGSAAVSEEAKQSAAPGSAAAASSTTSSQATGESFARGDSLLQSDALAQEDALSLDEDESTIPMPVASDAGEMATKPETAEDVNDAFNDDLMQREVSEASSDSNVTANKVEGGPHILTLNEPATSNTAAAPTTAATTPSIPTPTPLPESQQPDLAEEREDAISKALPPADATAIQTGGEGTPGGPLPARLDETTPPVAEAAAEVPAETSAEETVADEAEPEPSTATIEAAAEDGRGASTTPSTGPAVGVSAGVAAVPPANPDGLRNQIPQREPTLEEFVEDVESGLTTAEKRAQARQMLDELRADAESEKAAVLTEAETIKADIAAFAATQVASVQASMEAQIGAIQAHFASARSAMTAYVEQQKGAVAEQVAQEIAQVEADTASRIEEVQSQLTQRQTDLTAYAEEQRGQPAVIAEEESLRASSELETAALECERAGEDEANLYPGDEEPAPEKRQAARRVARDSAADIREKKPAIAEDLESRAADFSGQYMEYADTVNNQLSQAGETLIPALQNVASEATAALQQMADATSQGLDDRLQVDLQSLDAAESASVSQLQSSGSNAIEQIRAGAHQASGEVDSAAAALVVEIDRGVEEAAAVVSGDAEPFLPGIVDVIEAARATLLNTSTTGREQLSASASTAHDRLTEVADSFASQAAGLAAAAQGQAQSVQQSAAAGADQALSSRSQQAQETITGLGEQQQALIDEVLAEADRAIQEAREQIAGINDQFRAEIRDAANESIEEAKKPRTDQVEDRVHEAAEQVDEGWLAGLGRAVVQIAIGLVILVVVALVVAAIAAAFGVILTAWTAIMIAGAILLAVGLVMAIINRAGQRELSGNPAAIVGLALLDTVGITGIYEGISGHDIVTGEGLSDAARTERGVLGAVTLVGLVLGARAAIKGPPGGAFTRPSGLTRGWGGWGEVLPRGWRGIRSVATEMYGGLRQGVRDIREWFRSRTGRSPSPELLERVGEPSEVTTNRRVEQPYQNPPGTEVVNRGQPLDVNQLDPNQRYLWAIDSEGNFIRAPEGTRFDPRSGRYEFDPSINRNFGANADLPHGRAVKHGDLVPGPGDATRPPGSYRGSARAGGELIAERDASGNPTGRWIMNNDSSYTFSRTDGTTLGAENLDAAHELLGATGTDTGSIVPVNTSGAAPRGPLPPRPETPPPVVLPVTRGTEGDENETPRDR